MDLENEKKAQLVKKWDQVLGLELVKSEKLKVKSEHENIVSYTSLSRATIAQIDKRELARSKNNWQEADRIRKILEEEGLVITDTAHGTVVKKKE